MNYNDILNPTFSLPLPERKKGSGEILAENIIDEVSSNYEFAKTQLKQPDEEVLMFCYAGGIYIDIHRVTYTRAGLLRVEGQDGNDDLCLALLSAEQSSFIIKVRKKQSNVERPSIGFGPVSAT